MYCTRSNAGRRAFLQLPQELEQVLDVLAPLVEVERVPPLRDAALLLHLLRDRVHRDDALDVPAGRRR